MDVIITFRVHANQQQVDKTARLRLDSMAPVFPKNKKIAANSKEASRWSCDKSDYLEQFAGTYYIKMLDLDPEESWASDYTEMEMAHAFFFDKRTERPFLVLQAFEPLKIGKYRKLMGHGNGRLLLANTGVVYPAIINWEVPAI